MTNASSYKRIVFTIVACGFALFAAQIAWVGVFRFSQPAVALRIAPWDAQAKATLAARMLLEDQGSLTWDRAARLARSSLLRQPIQPVPIRILAGYREIRGVANDALPLMLASERLTRRDLLTQLWLIQYFSQTDDIDRVLSHYEIALTTSNTSWPILFPVLVSAVSDDTLTQSMSRFLARNRARHWRPSLISEIISKGQDPAQIAAVISPALTARDAVDRVLLREFVTRMVQLGAYDVAFSLYTGKTGIPLRDMSFLRDAELRNVSRFPPFDWELISTIDGISSSVPSGSRSRPELLLNASGTASGLVARKLLSFEASALSIRFDMSVEHGSGSDIEFVLECAPHAGASSPARVRSRLSVNGGPQNLRMVKPLGCSWLMLSIEVVGGRTAGDLAARISRFSVHQIGPDDAI